MGARIKVTGYIDPADLDGEDRDDADPTGLSESGFNGQHQRLGYLLEDLDFELVDED